MSEYEVAIKIAGKLDKSLQASVNSAQKMLGSLGKGGLSSALTGIGNAMESTGKALTAGVTMPVIALGATSVKEFGSVDKSMKLVQATMGSTNEEAATLEATMKKAAANSVFGMQDAADATLNFARQGFNAAQAGAMLTPALNLAAGTATDLSTVTGGLGNALKMFGKDANYATTAADILSTAQAQANTTVTDLFDAMATAGPICSSVGWSMSDLAAITDVFGDAGISGAEGATALKTGLARLASPAKDGAVWMKKLGLEIFNSDGSMKSMVEVQKQLHDSFQGLNSQEQMSAAAAIFGKNQMAKWMALINASPDQVQKYASSLEAATGSSQKMADALLSGMGGSLEKLSSSFDVFKYNVGGIASEVLKPFVDNLTGLIDKFNNLDPAMQKTIVKWVAIAAAAGPVLIIGGRIFKLAGSIVGTFGKLGKAAASVAKKTKGMSGPVKEGSSVMSAAAKNALGFGVGFAAAAAGVWILVKAAKELASAGPGAQVAIVLMAGAIVGMMAIAAQLAPKLQAGTQGLIAFGGAVLMAGAGMSLMALAATQIAATGPMALGALALMEGGMIALLAVAGAMGPQLAGASAGLLAFGGAVLMASAGMSLMAIAATQVAAAGPLAVAALTIMEVGMIAMMAVAAALGPALTAASVGLVAFGAAIVLAGAGCLIMVQAAQQIAAAGPAAQIALVALGAGLIAFGVIAGALAPVLLAGAAAIAALGAALAVVAAAAMLGSAALAIMSVSLPLLVAYGQQGASAILTLGGALTAFGASAAACGAGALVAAAGLLSMAAGAMAAGAGILVCGAGAMVLAAAIAMIAAGATASTASFMLLAVMVRLFGTAATSATAPILALTAAMLPFAAAALAMAAGATAGGAALLILAAGALAASVGMVPLAAALALAAASVEIIGASAKAAGSALKSMAKGATGTAAKMAIIAAGAAPLAAALAPLAVAAAAAAAAVLALAAGSTAAAAAIMLLVAGITLTAGALTLCSASIVAFKASAAGINAVATPTAAAFTRMAVAVAPFTAAITALAGPMMATSASMVVFAGGITVAAASATALAVSLRTTMATLGTLGALTTVSMNMVTVAIRNSMMQSNQAVVTGITVMRTTTQTGMITIVAVTRNGMTMFVVAVRTGGAQAVASCRSTSSQMVGAFSGLSGSMYSAGSYAMAGLRNGIAAGGAAAIAQARSIANQVAATVNSALKIHSPSRVLDQSGQFAGQGLAGGIQKTGALVQKAANDSLVQPVKDAGSKTFETPTFENRSSVIGETVSAFTGEKAAASSNNNQAGGQQFVFSPTYHFESGTPKKEDVVEANRMSQEEFKKMMKQYLRSEGRRSFA